METSHEGEREMEAQAPTRDGTAAPITAFSPGSPPAKMNANPAVLVIAPHAGHAVGLDQALELLRAAGIEVGRTINVTELYEHRPEGAGWRAAGFGSVIAAGGDGTVGTVATHVAESELPVGILPMGTANDVARSLAIPVDLAAASRVIAAGRLRSVDAGQTLPALTKPGALAVDPSTPPRGPDAPSPAAGAYFLHALTLGLNVEFAKLATDVARRERWGPLTYAASALEALQHFRPVPVTLRFPRAIPGDAPEASDSGGTEEDDDTVVCEVVQVVGLNTPVFGGGMNLRVPGVHTSDRMLDFVVIEAIEGSALRRTVEGLIEAMGRLGRRPGKQVRPDATPASASGSTAADDAVLGLALPGVRRFKTRWMAIETPTPVDVTMDGEVRAHTPVVVRVAPKSIRVFAPPTETE